MVVVPAAVESLVMVTAPVKEAGEVPLGVKIAMTVTTVSDVHRPVLVTL